MRIKVQYKPWEGSINVFSGRFWGILCTPAGGFVIKELQPDPRFGARLWRQIAEVWSKVWRILAF
jgi:hypothetical protein